MEWKDIESALDEILAGRACADDLESQFLDFKKYMKDLKELKRTIREYAVAFANADGGSLVFGVEDKIKGPLAITGCPKENKESTLTSDVYKNTIPSIKVDVEYHTCEGKDLLEIKIPKSHNKIRHSLPDGRCLIRVGAENLPFTEQSRGGEFISALEADYSLSKIDGLSWGDLDKGAIAEIKEFIQTFNPLHDFLSLDDYDLVKALNLVREEGATEYVTLSGLLFLGKKNDIADLVPQSETVMMEYDDCDDTLNQKIYSGSLLGIAKKVQADFFANYNSTQVLNTGLFDLTLNRMPPEVLREALLNSISHRDYSESSSVFVRIYPDRVEIANPGGFINGITPDNVLTHLPAWRNRNISEVFQKIGLVLRSGIGVDRMYKYLLANGKEPPAYRCGSSEVVVTFQDRMDHELAKYLQNEELERKHGKGEGLPLDEMIIIAYLRSRVRITKQEAEKIIQRGPEEAQTVLERMVRKQRLDAQGSGKGRNYILSMKLYSRFKESLGYARDKDIEKARQIERVMLWARSNGYVKSSDVQNLFSSSRHEAYALLSGLVDSGELVMEGNKRTAVYKINQNKSIDAKNYINGRKDGRIDAINGQ